MTSGAALATYRQGDVIELPRFVHGDVSTESAKLFAVLTFETDALVLITQTCDAVRDPLERPYVQVAPLVRINGLGDRAPSPALVAVPQFGEDAFADLDRVMTITKSLLVEFPRTHGVEGDIEQRKFSEGVARKFGRFAFPDCLTRSVEKLRQRVLDKWDKTESAEGQALAKVLQIRAEAAPSWAGDSIAVQLSFVVEPGILPAAEGPPEPDPELTKAVPAGVGPSAIAQRLATETSPQQQAWLWQRLGEEWAGCCKPQAPIVSIVGEVIGSDEYGLDRYWASEALDLDFLSGVTNVA
jgi:hypothetical protein